MGGGIVYESRLGDAAMVTDDSKRREFPVDWSFSGLSTAKRFNSGLRKLCSEISAKLVPLSLDPHSISAFHEVKSEILAFSGENFSSWYDHLRDKYIKEIADVYSEYGNFIPGFERLSLEDHGNGKKLLADCHAFGPDMFSLSFDELSHGQKILCILHLLLKTAPAGSTILIDEFENYLAPSEFVPFYNNALMAASERQLQIVLVSHHQKTLNWYHDQALIFSLDSTLPATVRVKKHDPDEYQGSLAERIEIEQG